MILFNPNPHHIFFSENRTKSLILSNGLCILTKLLLWPHTLLAHSLLILSYLSLTTCRVLSLVRRVLRRTLHDLAAISIVFVCIWIENKVKLVHVEVLEVAKAGWAIALIAVITEKAVFIVIDDSLASKATYWLGAVVWTDHGLTFLILLTLFVPVNAFLFHTQAEPLLRSPKSHQLIGKIFKHFGFFLLQ